MNLTDINSIYFLGIGGIGMSSLARYFRSLDKKVAGYDKTPTLLTEQLIAQGIPIHFSEDIDYVKDNFQHCESTLVVRTPAVPENNAELEYFRINNYKILKRAQVLGLLFNNKKGFAVAGTHGKTSVSTFTTYLLKESGLDCSAFLGGISKNYGTNLILGNSDYVVAEADEFDRSFLQLKPHISLVTTIDADHLDIYKDYDDIRNTFSEFIHQTDPEGAVILHQEVDLWVDNKYQKYTYSLDNPASDFYASDFKVMEGAYEFTFHTPNGAMEGFKLSVPGKLNIENCIAAMSIAWKAGISEPELKDVLPGLEGVERRVDIQFNSPGCVYIDDYAHHPSEIDAVISSIRDLYPEKKVTGIFQPHLYSRTRDFADNFAKSLSKLDELILLDIYPAREKPLPGVTSDMLLNKITIEKKQICSKENLLPIIKDLNIEVLLTLGAGDIDQFTGPIKKMLAKRECV
jgi:UDP-N-acetylmuramate--alanine ligase